MIIYDYNYSSRYPKKGKKLSITGIKGISELGFEDILNNETLY